MFSVLSMVKMSIFVHIVHVHRPTCLCKCTCVYIHLAAEILIVSLLNVKSIFDELHLIISLVYFIVLVRFIRFIQIHLYFV